MKAEKEGYHRKNSCILLYIGQQEYFVKIPSCKRDHQQQATQN